MAIDVHVLVQDTNNLDEAVSSAIENEVRTRRASPIALWEVIIDRAYIWIGSD
jgi:PIN domain nuclease of toxin-antitoxin system